MAKVCSVCKKETIDYEETGKKIICYGCYSKSKIRNIVFNADNFIFKGNNCTIITKRKKNGVINNSIILDNKDITHIVLAASINLNYGMTTVNIKLID